MYRAPVKFRASIVDRVTLLNVNVRVESSDGRQAVGFGSMPLGNVWSFPSATLHYDQTLDAMKRLAAKFAIITESYGAAGDPIEITPLCFSPSAPLPTPHHNRCRKQLR